MSHDHPDSHVASSEVAACLSHEEHKLAERIAEGAAQRLEQAGGVKKRLPKSISICGIGW